MGHHALSNGVGLKKREREREMAEGMIESRREKLQFCQVLKDTDWNSKNLEIKWNDNGKYNTEAIVQMQINFLSPLKLLSRG